MVSRKGVTMTFEQKRRTILHWDHQRQKIDHKFSLQQLSQWAQNEFNLPNHPAKNTLSNLISKHRDQFMTISAQDQNLRRTRTVSCPQVEEALVLWMLQMQQKRVNLSRDIIKEKGRRFLVDLGFPENHLKFSDTWMDLFQKRNGFRAHRSHGESGAANLNDPNVQARIAEIHREVSAYALRDRYNMDETALFYKMPPNTTIARGPIEGHKKDKTRFTIAFTCNADGTDRFKPSFIGHAAKPRCFNKKTGRELGFLYFHNKNAWMTGLYMGLTMG
jgi:Tc5 transposase DNA-binding domain/DDE superfamily endonuclease